MVSGSDAFRKRIGAIQNTCAIIHAAMMSTVPVYVVVAYAMQLRWDEQTSLVRAPVPTVPALVFYGFAAAAAALTMFLRARLPPADGSGPERWEKALMEAMSQRSGLRVEIAWMSRPEQRLVGLASLLMTRLIVVWAVLESVAVFGLIHAVLWQDWTLLFPFAATSLGLFVLTAPRIAERVGLAQSQLATAP